MEFLLVFADEAFDAIPDATDHAHEFIAGAIFKLYNELEKGQYEFYKEILKKYEQIKNQKMVFMKNPKAEDSSSEDNEDDNEIEVEGMEEVYKSNKPAQKAKKEAAQDYAKKFAEEEEALKDQKKKAKKNAGFGVEIKEEDQAKLDEEIKALQAQLKQDHPEEDDSDWTKS